MNAPVPPASDDQVDSLKQPNQFPGGYGQGFSSQSESTVDQPDIPQETLQSGKDGALGGRLSYIKYSTVLASCYSLYIMSRFFFHPVVFAFPPQEQVMPSAGGPEDSSPGYGQPGQSFYNSRAVPRGGLRNSRGMMNGYRGSSNGFRGTSVR